MPKAGSHHIPENWLEKECDRLALCNARKLMSQGQTPEEAARIACAGGWEELEGWVVARMLEDRECGGLKCCG